LFFFKEKRRFSPRKKAFFEKIELYLKRKGGQNCRTRQTAFYLKYKLYKYGKNKLTSPIGEAVFYLTT
jgi:hypothetical protein